MNEKRRNVNPKVPPKDLEIGKRHCSLLLILIYSSSSFNGSQSSRGSTNNTRERSTRWSGRNADEVDSDVATNGVHHEEYAMDISNAPGCELLTAQEQNLCSSIRLLPKVNGF